MIHDNPLYLIEGIVLSGQVLDHYLRACDKKDEVEIIVVDIEGRRSSTGCIKRGIAKRLEIMLSFYGKLSTLIRVHNTVRQELEGRR